MRLTPVIAIALCALLSACEAPAPEPIRVVGNSEHGRLLLRQYGCAGCHTIPGVAAARGNTGPTLAGIGRRAYLAGILPNTPDNMARWIASPASVDPLTVMPDMQVPPQHLRDIVAYLQTLH